MRTDAAPRTAAIVGRRAHPVRSAAFRSRRAEQSLVSELALVWRPHRAPAHDPNSSIMARAEAHALHPLSARSLPRPAGAPQEGGMR
jgi:hypothetical protein